MEAEYLVLLEGVRLCVDKYFTPTVVETDSQILCNMIQGIAMVPWMLHVTISHAKHLMSLGSFQIVHVFGETNTVADALARYASSSPNLTLRFDHQAPSFVRGLIRLDRVQTPSIRLEA
ncbi:hypothetical protein ACH5RR_008609 [Cinchona calisaya]|uniref:RNase H type-1 domain-containing protein n=1 Tax=Cinchona calisaya TaxID=153742 RepID=A0ABD3AC40_9GENT